MSKYFWAISVFSILFIWSSQSLVAQNLVPNPSFENWDGTSGSGGNTLDGLDDWYQANGTADHHHTDFSGNNLIGLSPCPLGQGNTECGMPVTGEAVLGCWKGNGIDGTREWAGVQLTQTMQIGSCYRVSFWIQNKEDDPNQLYETNQWGIFFSETMLPTFGANVIDYTNKMDQIVMTSEVIGDTIWHYIETEFPANEPYQYIYVGYQGNVANSTFTANNSSPSLGFYVWFDDITIEEITLPELTVSNDETICEGDSILISASSNYPVIWSHLDPDTTSSIWVKPQTTTTYYVQTQDSTKCSVLDSVIITVNPTDLVEYPDADVICLGVDPFILDPNSNNGTWSGSGITDAITSLFDPNLAGEGTHEIFFESNNDCNDNFILEVDVYATPTIDFAADINTGCAPVNVTFTDLTPIPGISYDWDFGNGITSNDLVSASTVYNDLGNYDVSLAVNYSDHCSATSTMNNFIQVGEVPTANFTFSPTEITNLAPDVQFENLSSQNANILLWDFGDGNSSSQLNPSYQYLVPGIYEVQLFATSPEGCQDSTSQFVTVDNQVKFYIPNAFSPDGNGYNDEFKTFPIGLVESYQIIIFDRWGSLVFQSKDLDEHWNGYVNGELAAEGVYVYLIEYQFADFINGGTQTKRLSGDVTIVK